MNAPKSKDVRNNVTETIAANVPATEAPKAAATPGVSLGNRRNRNPRKNGVAQQRAYVPTGTLPPLPTHKEDAKAETKVDTKATPATVEHAPEPEITMLDLDALAAQMSTQIVSGAVAVGLSLTTKQIQLIDNNCFNLLESTSPEVVTEEWAMGVATTVAEAFTAVEGEEINDESAVALAADINNHVVTTLTTKYTCDQLVHRYTAQEVADLVAERFEAKYQVKLPQEQLDGMTSFAMPIPESALCQWVVDLFTGFADIVADSMAEEIIGKIADAVADAKTTAADASDAADAADAKAEKPNDEAKPKGPVTKVTITSGTGHTREEVEATVEGDLSKGGEIHITLPAETLRVIALLDSSLVDVPFNFNAIANPKVILNRAILADEEVTLDTKERLVAEAFALRAFEARDQAEYRTGSLSFDFDLDNVSSEHIRNCYNGLGYTPSSFADDTLTKGHKTITIYEAWWADAYAA